MKKFFVILSVAIWLVCGILYCNNLQENPNTEVEQMLEMYRREFGADFVQVTEIEEGEYIAECGYGDEKVSYYYSDSLGLIDMFW